MYNAITITPKWQIHLPLKIRQQLNLVSPGKAQIAVENKKIVITPQESLILKMAGKYRHLTHKKKINLNKIRDHIDYQRL